MLRSYRTRLVLKLIGVEACAMVLAVWGFSIPFNVDFSGYYGNNYLRINAGEVIVWFEGGATGPLWPTRIDVRDAPFDGIGLKLPKYDPSSFFFPNLRLPIWVIFSFVVVPTAWLMCRDRRRIRPGHCSRCGYDLTGNTSGVCSECGEKAAMAKPPSTT